MIRLVALALPLLTCLSAAGCGSANGVNSGIPYDAVPAPVNPTPDMQPNPVPAKTPKR